MKQAIVHIGMHKAASSSIQRTMTLNRRRLLAAGFEYATFTEYGRDSSNHTAALLNLFEPPRKNLHVNLRIGKQRSEQIERAGEEFRRNLASDLPLIFSGEGASAMNRVGLKAMKDAFDSAGRDLRIIVFVRPPTELAESTVQQLIRGGAQTTRLPGAMGTWIAKRLTNIRKVFPRAEFHSFNVARKHPLGPVGYFADLLADNLSQRLRVSRANTRISAPAAELLLHVNKALPFMISSGSMQINPLRLHGDSRPFTKLPGPSFHLPPEELERLSKQISRQNAWLEQNLGPEFRDQGGAPDFHPVEWKAAQATDLRRLLRHLPPHMRVATADYFRDRADVPAELARLADRHHAGGNHILRYARGGPGIGKLELVFRKLRGQW